MRAQEIKIKSFKLFSPNLDENFPEIATDIYLKKGQY